MSKTEDFLFETGADPDAKAANILIAGPKSAQEPLVALLRIITGKHVDQHSCPGAITRY